MSQGILAIWHDIVPEYENEVLDWYDQEHHFERLAVLGFRNMRRYLAIDNVSPKLFIRYETDDVDVLSSPEYLARLNNPTSWTLLCQPQFRNNSRTVCKLVKARGNAEGGVVVSFRMQDSLPDEVLIDAAKAAAATAGILGWEHWVADIQRSEISTREKQLRGEADIHASAVLVFHARGLMEAQACLSAFELALSDTASHGWHAGIYRLAFSA